MVRHTSKAINYTACGARCGQPVASMEGMWAHRRDKQQVRGASRGLQSTVLKAVPYVQTGRSTLRCVDDLLRFGPVTDQAYESAYRTWRSSLTVLLADASQLERWQERRYRFAHQVGALLTEACGETPAVTGPVLYGVFATGAGLCYVGQTQEAERRLRDLPVGESHHLANTVPPEVWEKVVVIHWPLLLTGISRSEQSQVEEMGSVICGLALEHALQVVTNPPLNSRRRRTSGDWQPRNLSQSRSRGALYSQRIPALSQLTLAAWTTLSQAAIAKHSTVITSGAGRVVFPSALHELPGARGAHRSARELSDDRLPDSIPGPPKDPRG
jgi:hypothetical protein